MNPLKRWLLNFRITFHRECNSARSNPVCRCCDRIIQDEEYYLTLWYPFQRERVHVCTHRDGCVDWVKDLMTL